MNQKLPIVALDRETTYKAIKNLLLSGELGPGEALSERALSERFGVSRTPVREAIRTLANDGLLEIVPMRGYRLFLADSSPSSPSPVSPQSG